MSAVPAHGKLRQEDQEVKVSPEHRPGEQAGLSQEGGFLAATSGVVATAMDLESSMPTYPLTIGTGPYPGTPQVGLQLTLFGICSSPILTAPTVLPVPQQVKDKLKDLNPEDSPEIQE